jgi:hypothetical protein
MRAGDFVKTITDAVGIKQCGGCRKRQAAMNRVDLDGPLKEVALGLLSAIIDPGETTDGEETDSPTSPSREAGSSGSNDGEGSPRG